MIPFLAIGGGEEMPLWSVVPFALLLLSIAALPLSAPRWWHENRNKGLLAAALGLPVALFVLWKDPAALGHAGMEYAAFVCLIGSLFVISGGVHLTGGLAATPAANTGLLALGALLSNLVGTTGAAMLLIRPYLGANRRRRSRVHLVVFFILIVANCGGCLTPLGDPPLFLGFLKGVPFAWTLGLWREWLAVVAALLAVFYVWDRLHGRNDGAAEVPSEPPPREPLRIEGTWNLALLVGVMGVVLLSGTWVHPTFGETASQTFQSIALISLGALSLVSTPRGVRRANEFSWHPLVEVAVLFAGIFAAMVPALAILRTRGASLGVTEPWQFFWATGGLSAFLDNAPTYLAFLSMAQHLPDEVAGTTHAALAAISCGAVFFGALTYIGNGPNFMVKSIAEHAGVKMPSFLGYLAWSLAVLGPILAGATWVFFGTR